ncbi:MAG: transposase [Verrucomicrobia bacterium]|nr:transposase [Verrucomicrobiota bacterium]
MNKRVYQIVRDKRHWEGPLEPAESQVEQRIGSKGWYTRGYLPHYDKPGTIQMVTFRLADAMPGILRHQWQALFKIENSRLRQRRIEEYMDRGMGECHLRNPEVAAAVESVLLAADGKHYRLAAWVLMPNHVHALVELWDLPLGRLLNVWKGASAHKANMILRRQGRFWQAEYWDCYIRDEAHFRKALKYIELNPVKAMLARYAFEWPFSSANPKWQWSGCDRYRGAHLLNAGCWRFEPDRE